MRPCISQYSRFGPAGFWAMGALCTAAFPVIWLLHQALVAFDSAGVNIHVPRLACCTRGRSGKPHDDRGNLLHLVAADSDHARFCGVFDPSDYWSLVGLLRRLRNGPRPDVLQMSPMLKSCRWIRRGDREG